MVWPKCWVCVLANDNIQCYEMPRVKEGGEVEYAGCVTLPLTILSGDEGEIEKYTRLLEEDG